jgi:hypothetical protein
MKASGYCLLKSWRKAVGLLPDTALRCGYCLRLLSATNAAPQEGVDSLPVGNLATTTDRKMVCRVESHMP